jgi:hypothetical protein
MRIKILKPHKSNILHFVIQLYSEGTYQPLTVTDQAFYFSDIVPLSIANTSQVKFVISLHPFSLPSFAVVDGGKFALLLEYSLDFHTRSDFRKW